MVLFMSISGGMDWDEILWLLADLSVVYAAFYCFYVAFVVFGVLNVVTAVFVDNAWQIAQMDRDLVVQEQTKKKEAYMKELKNLFMEADIDESGSLSWEEFEEHLQDDRVQAYLSTMELDVTEAHSLFKLLDLHNQNKVHIDDFVNGCMRLKGGAKSIDVCTLLYENRKFNFKLEEYTAYAEKQFQRLEKVHSLEPMITPSERASRRSKKSLHMHTSDSLDQHESPHQQPDNRHGGWRNTVMSDEVNKSLQATMGGGNNGPTVPLEIPRASFRRPSEQQDTGIAHLKQLLSVDTLLSTAGQVKSFMGDIVSPQDDAERRKEARRDSRTARQLVAAAAAAETASATRRQAKRCSTMPAGMGDDGAHFGALLSNEGKEKERGQSPPPYVLRPPPALDIREARRASGMALMQLGEDPSLSPLPEGNEAGSPRPSIRQGSHDDHETHFASPLPSLPAAAIRASEYRSAMDGADRGNFARATSEPTAWGPAAPNHIEVRPPPPDGQPPFAVLPAADIPQAIPRPPAPRVGGEQPFPPEGQPSVVPPDDEMPVSIAC